MSGADPSKRLLPMRGSPDAWCQGFLPGQVPLCPHREADGKAGEQLGALGLPPSS